MEQLRAGERLSAGAPQVSVLIAARDAAGTLARTLRSVQRQTLRDWECVVVDDGSRDATADVVHAAASSRDATAASSRSPAAGDPRIRLLSTDAQGVVAARNAGLEACRAPLIALLDADDLMHPRRLELQTAALAAQPEWIGVGCRVRYVPRGAAGPGMRAYEAWLNEPRGPEEVARDRYIEMPVGHPALMLRSEALRQVGGWHDRGWPEDWDLLQRLLHAGSGSGAAVAELPAAGVGVLPQRLLAWRLRADSLSRSSPAYTQEAFTRCRAAFLAEQYLADADSYTLCGYGGTGRALRRALAEHGKRLTLVAEVHPGRIGQRIHGAPVVPLAALADERPPKLIASVAGAAPRAKLRAALAELGLLEGRDFICAA